MISLINKIDCGYCINNASPRHESYCDCFKYDIPYQFFQNSGVIFLCKEWVTYCIEYRNEELAHYSDKYWNIRNIIIEEIKKRYPKYNYDEIKFSNYSSGMGSHSNLGNLSFKVCEEPIPIYIHISPSYLINSILWEDMPLWYFNHLYEPKYSYQLNNKWIRKLKSINKHNINAIPFYMRTQKRIKKYSQIFEELQNKINRYETIN